MIHIKRELRTFEYKNYYNRTHINIQNLIRHLIRCSGSLYFCAIIMIIVLLLLLSLAPRQFNGIGWPNSIAGEFCPLSIKNLQLVWENWQCINTKKALMRTLHYLEIWSSEWWKITILPLLLLTLLRTFFPSLSVIFSTHVIRHYGTTSNIAHAKVAFLKEKRSFSFRKSEIKICQRLSEEPGDNSRPQTLRHGATGSDNDFPSNNTEIATKKTPSERRQWELTLRNMESLWVLLINGKTGPTLVHLLLIYGALAGFHVKY